MKRAEIATTYLAAWLLVFLAAPASAADPLHAADLRLLRVAERLQDANVDLCDRRSPALGAALQSRDQYPDDAQPGF